MSANLPYHTSLAGGPPLSNRAEQEVIDTICQAVQETLACALFDWSALDESTQARLMLHIDTYLQTELKKAWVPVYPR